VATANRHKRCMADHIYAIHIWKKSKSICFEQITKNYVNFYEFKILSNLKVSNRLIFFTALFSYFILLVLGIRGFLLPGAGAGILFYLTPEWDRMGDFHVWIDAASIKCDKSYNHADKM
jgi:hypothetical protein